MFETHAASFEVVLRGTLMVCSQRVFHAITLLVGDITKPDKTPRRLGLRRITFDDPAFDHVMAPARVN